MLRGDGPMIDMMVEGQPLHKMMVEVVPKN